MRSTAGICLLAVVAGWMVGCAPPPAEEEEVVVVEEDTQSAEEMLSETTDAWIAAFNAGDAVAIAEMMGEDGMLLPPNSEPVVGREAIAEFWQAVIDTGITGSLEMTQIIAGEDIAVKIGEYDLFDSEGEMVDTGKWMEVWTRVGEEWEFQRDIWNSNLPAAELEE